MAKANSDRTGRSRRSAPHRRMPKRSTQGKRTQDFRKERSKKSRRARLHKIPQAVQDAIDKAAVRLHRASALLICLRYAADYAPEREFCAATVAEVIYELVDEAFCGLDPIYLARAGEESAS